MRADAVYCSGRCRMAAHRAARAQRSAGLDPQAEPSPVEASPAWRRQEVDGALLRLAGKAVQVMNASIGQNDVRVAEWTVERAVARHAKPGAPAEKSPRMREEEARAELERKFAKVAAEYERERLLEEERLDEENASQGWPWKRSVALASSDHEPRSAAPSWLAFG